ncbi:KGK domain-containing protein [Altericista sp. CCNU0014]|uniref:KGK domain-containing protein n=1 Tax=Altericista sp. CCNU0014 TaxID=3082949 RepID=UPI00384F89A1
MVKIQLSEKDVVSFEDFKPLGLSRTNKFSAFQEKLEDFLKRYGLGNEDLLRNGIKCEILQLGSQEWQQGHLRIRVEFSPELKDENSDLNKFRDSEI